VTFSCGGTSGQSCLPALFEDGQRLHDLHGASLFDLDLIFRQHELCHRPKQRSAERKIALLGNSAVFGLDVPADRSFAGLLNRRWDASKEPAHIYNLGFVTSYQFKDALITRRTIDYAPDLIVFGITLSDFIHLAPVPWPDTLPRFFAANDAQIDRLSEEGAAGLEDVVAAYLGRDQYRSGLQRHWIGFRESGAYVRLAVRHTAPALVNRWLLSPEDGGVEAASASGKILTRGKNYRCEKVVDAFARTYGTDWSSWNILAYLEQIEREHGIDVVIVDLPSQHDPNGACFNARQPASADIAYRHWLRKQTALRKLELWDLHDLLTKSQFEDSIHPTESGHRKIAEALGSRLEARFAAATVSDVELEMHTAAQGAGREE